jgi:hypothetical protein
MSGGMGINQHFLCGRMGNVPGMAEGVTLVARSPLVKSHHFQDGAGQHVKMGRDRRSGGEHLSPTGNRARWAAHAICALIRLDHDEGFS